MFKEQAKIRDVATVISSSLGNSFKMEVKGGAACAHLAYDFLRKYPELSETVRDLAMLDVSDLDIQVHGAAHQKQAFVRSLQSAAPKLTELLQADTGSFSAALKQLGKSTQLLYTREGKSYYSGGHARPLPLHEPSFVCPTLHGDIADSASKCTCSLARICVAAANLRSQYVAMLPIIDIVWHPEASHGQIIGEACSHGVRSAYLLFEDNVRMVCAETQYRPWLSNRPEKAAKRMRRMFGLLLILVPMGMRRRLYRRAQKLNSAISEIMLAEQERQCKPQSKLEYLLHGSSSVANTRPLETLHKKRARGPMRMLIGNIRTCLENAPHPGTGASAEYLDWLELVSSCCFEYEHGLSILCRAC